MLSKRSFLQESPNGLLYPLMLCLTWLCVQISPEAYGDPACDGRFEGKTVKLIVPSEAGGGYDLYSRLFAPHYAAATGSDVLVENWPEGGGSVGAKKVMEATPDGLTFGLLNAPKMTVSRIHGGEEELDILRDFTILGRISTNRYIIATGGKSDIDTFDSLFGMDPPAVFGVSSERSGSYIAIRTLENLLGAEFDVVFGMGGARKRVLAVSRGDVDLIMSNSSSVYSDIESGEIKPLALLASGREGYAPSLADVPLIGGVDGIVSGRAKDLGVEPDPILEVFQNLESLVGAGRLFVGPPDLNGDLEGCLLEVFYSVLKSQSLFDEIAAANLSLDAIDGVTARENLNGVFAGLDGLVIESEN